VLTDGAPGVRFSISHAGGLLVVAATRGVDVGVDVESAERDTHGWAVWRHVLTESELAAIPAEAAKRRVALLAAWTAKEAILKGAGVGLSVDPREIEVRGDRVVSLPRALGNAHEWSLAPVAIDGFVATVACRSPSLTVERVCLDDPMP
jgi:4'-phosphopantetheinyl transferase